MLHIEKSIHKQIQNYDAIVTFSWRFIAYYEKNVLRVPLVVNRFDDTIRSRKSKKGIQCNGQKKKGMQYNDQKKKGMQYNGQKKKGMQYSDQKKTGMQYNGQRKKGMQYNGQKKKGMQYNGQKKNGIPCNGQKKSKNRTKYDLQVTTQIT